MDKTLVPRKAIWAAATFAAAALMPLVSLGASWVWTELQWYQEVHAKEVLLERILSQGGIWLAATAVSAVVFFVAIRVAKTVVRTAAPGNGWSWFIATALAGVISVNPAMKWTAFRLAMANVPFGLADPQFGRDVGFFVFTLPVLEVLQTWLDALVVVSAIITVAIVLLPEFSRSGDGDPERWHRAQSLGAVYLGVVLLCSAVGGWIAIWRLDLGHDAQVAGASYTDAHVLVPAYWAMIVATVICALVFFATARTRRFALQGSTLLALGVTAVVLTGALPSLEHEYIVAPNELTLETPYIQRSIRMSQRAWGLESVRTEPFSAGQLSADSTAAVPPSLAGSRVWTPSTVAQALTQLQTIRPYYRLSKIQTDRYEIGGVSRQVLVAAREIDATRLPRRARTWVNTHLVYTHGYGLAICSASETNPQGFPDFLVGDVPPVVRADVATMAPGLATVEPRIYYGPDMREYAVVNTVVDEFDYPAGEHNKGYRSASPQGVRAGGGLSRLAWALRLGSSQLLFSKYVTPDSEVLINRDVTLRAQRIAPWLTFSEDPYPAIVAGRIVWILDGFTSSDHFPYSQALPDGTNYLRSSVKAVVDATDGSVTLFAVGDDPIRDAWSRVFPGLIRPEHEASNALTSHFRYPARLLEAQAEVYRTLHMSDPVVFYNKEDQWDLYAESPESQGRASYLTCGLAGSAKPSLRLLVPFSPQNRDNLTAWLFASSDPGEYGRLTCYRLPKDRVVFGPKQIRARIEQDPVISPQLSLWDQRGSEVILGEMTVMPVADSVVYVQPVFMRAETSSVTQLAGVAVVNGDRIALGRTLDLALAQAVTRVR